MSGLSVKSPWTRRSGAIIWREGGGAGIDPAGSGSVCARVKFAKEGTYYMTAHTKAPHGTDHNDAWFRFSGGLSLLRRGEGTMKVGNTGWYKGYQNLGAHKMADYILTIDFNGHQFVTKKVAKGAVYDVCVGGRSSRFAVYDLLFVMCDGVKECDRGSSIVKDGLNSIGVTKCT